MYRHIYLFCMGRGGGNAVLYWILGEIEGDVQMLTKNGMRAYFNEDMNDGSVRVLRENVQHGKHQCCLSEFDRMSKEIPAFSSLSDRIILYSLRDPYNMMASFLKNWQNKEAKLYPSKGKANEARDEYIYDKIIPEWKALAYESLGHTSILPASSRFINYNEWAISKDYRKQLAESLHLNFKDAQIDYVPAHGGGSSFTGTKSLNKNDLFNRWQAFRDNAVYRKIFEDDELVGLSDEIFSVRHSL